MTVQAPYHFVPLSKWVYMPDWAHLVSHDVPFEDGVSGVIEYTLTNHTPLCVGDTKDENGVLKFARNPSGELVIPSSSLKGMIRSVLEIASFGKFSAVDDRKFSYRDISSNSDYLKNVIDPNEVISGWIKFNQDKNIWQFFQCDHGKIYHSDLNKSEGVTIKNVLTAMKKYEQLPLSRIIKATTSHNSAPKKISKVTNVGHGKVAGNCVFTHNRIIGRGSAEDYEFSYFFYNKKTEAYSEDISDLVKDLFANHRGLVTSEKEDSDLVSFLEKNQSPEHGIPVFALKINGKVTCFGFAKMPRVTYKNSTVDLVNNHNSAHTAPSYFDMAELMFGTLREDGFGLKSRIFFSDAVLSNHNKNKVTTYKSKPTVLSSPKATFIGGYIRQVDTSSYKSYDHNDAKLNGWKRYPIRPFYQHFPPPKSKSDKSQSCFELLPEKHQFIGKIVFHNLKPQELSALIWSISLGNSDHNYHSLGHAKPLGAGSISISVEKKSYKKSNLNQNRIGIDINKESEKFDDHMNTYFSDDCSWLKSPQIQHLLALTDIETINYDHEQFKYMALGDYQNVKNNFESLPPIYNPDYECDVNDVNIKNNQSLAYNKGRLSSLLEPNQELIENIKLQDANIHPIEKVTIRLTSIVDNQLSYSETEKNKITKKELPSLLNELKQLEKESMLYDIEKILDIANSITIAKKQVDRITKFLGKL